MSRRKETNNSLSATNLAAHHHFQCDLFLYHSYYGSGTRKDKSQLSELSKAQFQRGNDWESTLLTWLDNEGLLLQVLSSVLEGLDLEAIIEMDDRDHFFITGLSFWPPMLAFAEKFRASGSRPIRFGIAKPDLVEIKKQEDGTVRWQVIDAKSSKDVKTSHHVQIYFYHLCLQHLLPSPRYNDTGFASVWLPPSPFSTLSDPSNDGLKPIATSLLALSLDDFFFRRLPTLLSLPSGDVKWHYNPVCRGCPYEISCKTRAVADGELGAMANVSIQDAEVLRSILDVSCSQQFTKELSDIEELDLVVQSSDRMANLRSAYPSTARKVQRILRLPARDLAANQSSPLILAAKTKRVHIINSRNFAFPKDEDITVIISLVQDPSVAEIAAFSVSVFSAIESFQPPRPVFGLAQDLIDGLAKTLQIILDLRPLYEPPPRTQCYVFSSGERASLQAHLINAALTSDPLDTSLQSSIRMCIGVLCEGASLLSTSFQPLLLSGALLDFLGKKGNRTKAELQFCLDRLGLLQYGSNDEIHHRIQAEIKRLKGEGGRDTEPVAGDTATSHPELGLLPRIVIVKREIERLLALPVPGYWDLPGCYLTLIPRSAHAESCPSDEELFELYKDDRRLRLESRLQRRNKCIHQVIKNVRRRVSSTTTKKPDLLVNQARVLSTNFMDICRQEHVRKLFFMQQFEVLTKLTGLWHARIEGCPDAPLLEYEFRNRAPDGGHIHSFTLISGNIDLPADKERSFYEYILTEDKERYHSTDRQFDVPVEALFNDLGVSNLVFPLNKHTKAKWTCQPKLVQDNLFVADIQDIAIHGGKTRVTLRTFGSYHLQLAQTCRYRLSPRLVDFNLTKVLGTLVELDLQIPKWPSYFDLPPFLQLFTNPRFFAMKTNDGNITAQYLRVEATINSLFKELQSLGSVEAGALLLKTSQRRASRRILANRLAIIWGPPGTGKTYTISLSLLRFLEVRSRCDTQNRQIIFLTAMTHAAIEACLSKLKCLIGSYRGVKDLQISWLDDVCIEHVTKGSTHPLPDHIRTYIYAGTVYQLFNFSKRSHCEVDCVVIDEAGQLGLGPASLVLRSLRPDGRVIVAGDSEQLAPILTAQYPQLESRIFGSILDCLMYTSDHSNSAEEVLTISASQMFSDASEISTIIQLTENFRLNPDLGEFISTIYSKAFKPQKAQARKVATQLKQLANEATDDPIYRDARDFLVALAGAMLRSPEKKLQPPQKTSGADKLGDDPMLMPRPISLALIRLKVITSRPEQIGYETHVRGEAVLAASLVRLLRKVAPSEQIFVATPHRIQRQAVNEALKCKMDELETALNTLRISDDASRSVDIGKVTVDTIERLQGSEAAFVICLFSQTHTSGTTAGLDFLLQRRRLNVAISRAQTLCILITSDELLSPSVRVLANTESAKGLAFLHAFEERAWSTTIGIDLDRLL